MPDILRVTYLCDHYGCQEALLTDPVALARLLSDLASEIGMEAVSEPLMAKIATDGVPFIGYSGSLIIKQSHANCHSYPQARRLEIAIDSCQQFDYRQATAYAAAFMGAGSSTMTYMVQEWSSQTTQVPLLAERESAVG